MQHAAGNMQEATGSRQWVFGMWLQPRPASPTPPCVKKVFEAMYCGQLAFLDILARVSQELPAYQAASCDNTRSSYGRRGWVAAWRCAQLAFSAADGQA
jgi:hypothetical protein